MEAGGAVSGRPAPTAQGCPHRFVSDHAPSGMAALCQHKLLVALEQTRLAPETTRAHPPTQLEWTAGRRRGRMVLDVFTLNGDAASSGASLPLMLPGPPPCFTPTSYSPVLSCFWAPLGTAAPSRRGEGRRLSLSVPTLVPQTSASRQRWSPGLRGSSLPGGFCTAGAGAWTEGAAGTECGPAEHLLQLPEPRATACAPQRGEGAGQVGRVQTR